MKVVSKNNFEKVKDDPNKYSDLYFTIPSGAIARKWCRSHFDNDFDYDMCNGYIIVSNEFLWSNLKYKDDEYKKDLEYKLELMKNEVQLHCSEIKDKRPYKYTVKVPVLAFRFHDYRPNLLVMSNLDPNEYEVIFDECEINMLEFYNRTTAGIEASSNSMGFINFSVLNYNYDCSCSLDTNGDIQYFNGYKNIDDEDKIPTVAYVYFNFNVKKKDEESNMIMTNNKFDNEITSTYDTSMYYEPDKVKAIRETIEAVMKNTGKTDLKDIDLDMLSSCINATFNREKLFYKWLNEFTSDEVSEDKIKFAFKFLDWVILNKIDSEKTNGIYFKE